MVSDMAFRDRQGMVVAIPRAYSARRIIPIIGGGEVVEPKSRVPPDSTPDQNVQSASGSRV
jgi:hypothetical protein